MGVGAGYFISPADGKKMRRYNLPTGKQLDEINTTLDQLKN
jgi:hypothetical protein